MSDKRQTLEVADGRGERWWVDLTDAGRWERITPLSRETLYCIDGRWLLVVEDALTDLLGRAAVGRLVMPADAAWWFLRRGMPLPDRLVQIAGKWRLQASTSVKSRNTARRRKRRHRRARQAAKRSQPGSGRS